MFGWKVVLDFRDTGQFCSAFTPATGWAKWFYLNQPTLSPSAPMFFHGDDAQAAHLLWALRSNGVMAALVAVLRVEAAEPVMEIGYVAQEQSDYTAYWQAILAGGSWPAERSYQAHPLTYAAPSLTPVAVAWRGLQFSNGEDVAARLAEVQASMAAARGTVQPAPVTDKQIFFPVAAR